MLDHSIAALLRGDVLRAVVVSISEDDVLWQRTRHSGDPSVTTCVGGTNRMRSVMCALDTLKERADEGDWVLVHDAVRPCLSGRDLSSLIEELGSGDGVGGLLVAPVSDTMKQVRHDAAGRLTVERTLDRGRLVRALTPQMFRFGLLAAAIDHALRKGVEVGDEAQAMEFAGHAVHAVEGDGANVKLTYPHELPLIEDWLARNAR